jgi:hypothetical protein
MNEETTPTDEDPLLMLADTLPYNINLKIGNHHYNLSIPAM